MFALKGTPGRFLVKSFMLPIPIMNRGINNNNNDDLRSTPCHVTFGDKARCTQHGLTHFVK